MGTHFGHPYKSFEPSMPILTGKEHPMQILGRIGPTVSMKSGDLHFGLERPQRTDLTSSNPPFWGVPNNFYFMNFFDPRSPSDQNGHLSVLGIKWAPHLRTPIKFFTPLWPPPVKNRSRCKNCRFGFGGLGPIVWAPNRNKQTDIDDKFIYERYGCKNI